LEEVARVSTGSARGAFGIADWGYVAGDADFIALVRLHAQRHHGPANYPVPLLAAAAATLSATAAADAARARVLENASYFRERLQTASFKLKAGAHPILAVTLSDAGVARKMVQELLADGFLTTPVTDLAFATGETEAGFDPFIRLRVSAAHETAALDEAIVSLLQSGRRQGVLPTFCMYQRKR
jgi:glycine C-acetyltransferase